MKVTRTVSINGARVVVVIVDGQVHCWNVMSNSMSGTTIDSLNALVADVLEVRNQAEKELISK